MTAKLKKANIIYHAVDKKIALWSKSCKILVINENYWNILCKYEIKMKENYIKQ